MTTAFCTWSAEHQKTRHHATDRPLGRVVRWPRAGEVFFSWVDDPELPEYVEHRHQSSTIRNITRLSAEDSA